MLIVGLLGITKEEEEEEEEEELRRWTGFGTEQLTIATLSRVPLRSIACCSAVRPALALKGTVLR